MSLLFSRKKDIVRTPKRMKSDSRLVYWKTVQKMQQEGLDKRVRLKAIKALGGNDKKTDLAKVAEDSKPENRFKQYEKEGINSIGRAPFWPPMSPKIIESLKEGKTFEANGFKFLITTPSNEIGRITFFAVILAGYEKIPIRSIEFAFSPSRREITAL